MLSQLAALKKDMTSMAMRDGINKIMSGEKRKLQEQVRKRRARLASQMDASIKAGGTQLQENSADRKQMAQSKIKQRVMNDMNMTRASSQLQPVKETLFENSFSSHASHLQDVINLNLNVK